ncbi:hypothetical protein D187_004309 [Cystobacter fuscus DSM 2262]|uniref:Uncharacterized protein n=1 Tax=Cystobacter fuscus (strain ATCC 25194 / DSM 2262 / NBRC 100088 / M29) TaxID=1242864 RepID=S9P0P7_CYSF2|nr:hypothetical protein [Cystobacter fuscus]EPX58020.1 hypothetical protein D187_004309 [Cystobacter fuscus DSM 2262]
MMKTLKVGLLGLALGVASAFVLPSQVAMAGSSSGGAGGTTNPTQGGSTCNLCKLQCDLKKLQCGNSNVCSLSASLCKLSCGC